LFWDDFDAGDDARVGEALVAAAAAIDEDALLQDHAEGTPTRLSIEEQALVPLDHAVTPDPAKARGLSVTTRYTCAMDQLAAILVFPDQNAIYDSYDAYSRTFDAPTDRFLAGDEARAGWVGEITATIPLGVGTYSYPFRTELRRLPLPEDHPSSGEAIVARTFMTDAAVWEKDGRSFPQDYQIEVYWPVGADIVHLYGFWREMDFGASVGTMEDDLPARITVQQVIVWDDKTEKACADGLP
ncbi:MAG TPA: hypothetical protein PKA64_17265, partial [Myxococcota bacterium]|nr:hypothetical protein [Myxococcota bacterium]